jgi:hypothetical protein
MKAKRIKELLLLQAIAQHADPFGFAFPGIKALKSLIRCSKATLDRLMTFLVEGEYIKVYETYNPRRGKTDTDFQISPCVLYVRDEIQAYCEALWMGQERDFSTEKKFRENLLRTKESQPDSDSESVPDSETRLMNQNQHHHHHRAQKAQKPAAAPRVTTGDQRESAKQQRQPAQTEKDNPQAGGPGRPTNRDLAPFRKPFATLDDEDLAQDIKITVGTQLTQARYAVATYDRGELRIALELTRQKRARGELSKPGGYFFAMLNNGVIVPADDGPAVFKPRTVMGETEEQDYVQHWNPETGRYEPAAGE